MASNQSFYVQGTSSTLIQSLNCCTLLLGEECLQNPANWKYFISARLWAVHVRRTIVRDLAIAFLSAPQWKIYSWMDNNSHRLADFGKNKTEITMNNFFFLLLLLEGEGEATQWKWVKFRRNSILFEQKWPKKRSLIFYGHKKKYLYGPQRSHCDTREGACVSFAVTKCQIPGWVGRIYRIIVWFSVITFSCKNISG